MVKEVSSANYSQEKSWGKGYKPIPSKHLHTANFLRRMRQPDGSDILVVHGALNSNSGRGSVYLLKPLEDTAFETFRIEHGGSVGELRICDVDHDGLEEIMLGASSMIQDAAVILLDVDRGTQAAFLPSELRRRIDGFGYPVAPTWTGTGGGLAVYDQDTDLFSAEVNGVVKGTYRIDWLTGFRWIGMNDSLVGYVPMSGGPDQNLSYTGSNSLYGGQMGANILLMERGGPLRVYCAPKVGLYLNQADGRYFNYNNNDTGGGFRNQVAFAGDLSINARYRVTDRFSVQIGYQLLWLNGIAVATDQAAVAGPDSVTGTAFNSSGSAFFHGALVGGNFCW